MKRTAFLVALLAVATVASAQAPHEAWRTITTPRFRVHYPARYESWSVRAAERLESIRTAVEKEVGYQSDAVIDVVIGNPVAASNGLAWPILGAPRVVFYVEPPGPQEQIGAYSTWIDLLATHEIAHIVHMLRPSRNPLQRAAERFVLPLDPITLSAPRWVLEGYATVIEGRLTGAGRPPGTMRAMILRKWAASGRLPSYAQLDSDNRFLGMSMAYLAGSAYLEWLEQRAGAGSLQKLWLRMTARERRSFDAAFAGVFGDTPQRLYGQFTSELTASALAVERAAPLREGELWQETERASGDPVVSPDGARIAVVLRPRDAPARLVVWATAAAKEEERKYEQQIARMLQRDPLDVAPVRARPLPRKPLYSFTAPDGGDIATPRWAADGKSLLFTHRQPDRDGSLHHDLFLWFPEADQARRVTHLADVEDADPLPGGRSAVAVRTRFGLSQLVVVDLDSGAVEPLTVESLDNVYSQPRVDRSGDRIAFIVNRGGIWSLVIRDRKTAAEHVVLSERGVSVLAAEWSRTAPDLLFATLDTRGFAELYRVTLAGAREPVTRSSGAAVEPAPSPDGRVFFMGLEPDGFVLRVANGSTAAPPVPAYDAALVPALPPQAAAPPPLVDQQVVAGKPYGVGGQEASWLAGEILSPSEHATEVGLRLGDIVGRLDTLAIGSIGSREGQRGAALISAWRGWPVTVSGHAFAADDHIVRRSGLELRGSWTGRFPLSSVTLEAGGVTGERRSLGFVDATYSRRQLAGRWRFSETLRGSAEAGSLRHFRVVGAASVRQGGWSFGARVQHDGVHGEEGRAAIEVGGARSSVLPASATPERVFDPALPVSLLTGRRYDGTRFEATTPVLPVTLFYQLHRTGGMHLGMAGAEVRLGVDPMPLLKIPGLDITAGAARILDEPLRHRTRAWLAMRWRP